MATKPSVSTEWASNVQALKEVPTTEQQSYGWSTSDNTVSGVPVKPNLQNQNGWQHNVHLWKEYFEKVTDETHSWELVSNSKTITRTSLKNIYVVGQTDKVFITLSDTDILAGDTFRIKNLGSESLLQNDNHFVVVKSTSTSSSLIAWLWKDDECIIKAKVDFPATSNDWEIIDIKRPYGHINMLTLSSSFDATSVLSYSTDFECRDMIWVDEDLLFYGLAQETTANSTKIFALDHANNVVVKATVAGRFYKILYVANRQKYYALGWDGSDVVLIESLDAVTWDEVGRLTQTGSPLDDDIKMFEYEKTYDTLITVFRGTDRDYRAAASYPGNSYGFTQVGTSLSQGGPSVVYDPRRKQWYAYQFFTSNFYYSTNNLIGIGTSPNLEIKGFDGSNWGRNANVTTKTLFCLNKATGEYVVSGSNSDGFTTRFFIGNSPNKFQEVPNLITYDSTGTQFLYPKQIQNPYGVLLLNKDGRYLKSDGHLSISLHSFLDSATALFPLNNQDVDTIVGTNGFQCGAYCPRTNRLVVLNREEPSTSIKIYQTGR